MKGRFSLTRDLQGGDVDGTKVERILNSDQPISTNLSSAQSVEYGSFSDLPINNWHILYYTVWGIYPLYHNLPSMIDRPRSIQIMNSSLIYLIGWTIINWPLGLLQCKKCAKNIYTKYEESCCKIHKNHCICTIF